MPKIKDLPKTYELTDEDVKTIEENKKDKLDQLVENAKNIDWNKLRQECLEADKKAKEVARIEARKVRRFEITDKLCVVCKGPIIEFWKKKYTPSNGICGPGGRTYPYWEPQGHHCQSCGLKYEFTKLTEFEDE